MKLELQTREYEFSHGKQPRGIGHWAFTIVAVYGPGSHYTPNEMKWVARSCTLAQAKSEIKKDLKARYGQQAYMAVVKVMP